MTLGFAATVASSFLNIFRATNWTAPTSIYIQLHTGDPGAAGTANISAGSTARHSFTFAAPSGNALALASAPSAWTNGGATETLTHASIWDASTSGTFLDSFALTANYPWANTQTFNLSALAMIFAPVAA